MTSIPVALIQRNGDGNGAGIAAQGSVGGAQIGLGGGGGGVLHGVLGSAIPFASEKGQPGDGRLIVRGKGGFEELPGQIFPSGSAAYGVAHH